MMESDGETVTEGLIKYIWQTQNSTNTQLFSVLALLNAYVPGSTLPMQMCQQILGPPDPIHGGPPFEERMEPFTNFISTSQSLPNTPGQVSMGNQEIAQEVVESLDKFGINRSATAKQLLLFICEGEPQPGTVNMVKDLLIKREMAEEGKEKFSRLISDILKHEKHQHAVSVLKTASEKFRHVAIYPQTIARLLYIVVMDYETAAKWAETAIERDPCNSYVADTLGQVYKNRLRNYLKCQTSQGSTVQEYAYESLRAFKAVEEKAMKEEDPQNVDPDGSVRTSASFNNRGHFGFIQVAKIVFQTLRTTPFTTKLREEVEDKFEFFEWYLTYSMPDMKTLEPSYFWKDIACCYDEYTGKAAASSTSFPGILDFLNHDLFLRRRRGEEVQRTTAELEGIEDDLKNAHQENRDDVVTAIRYILSNVILSNRRHDAPQLARLTRLQAIIRRFFNRQPTQPPQPEFYLLALMLYWPEEQLQEAQQEADDEVGGQAAEDESNDKDTDEDQETEQEAPLPPGLQQQVRSMKNAFEGTYAKYLRGRYLVPLFFLGKGRGLSKWIHKSRLDAIVEEEIDSKLAEQDERTKTEMINDMWCEGEVWQIQKIRELLHPVQVDSHQFAAIPEKSNVQEVSVRVGGQELQAKIDVESLQTSELFYLYFTIEGPVVIGVSTPDDDEQ